MATQQLKSTNYFPHDSNARNDERLLRLRMKHGAAGYGVYFMLLERLREEAGYTSVKDYNIIAFDLRVDASVAKSVVEDFGLFAFTEDGKRFYSESFSRRMGMKDAQRKRQEEGGKLAMAKRWNTSESKEEEKPQQPKDGNRQHLKRFLSKENREIIGTLLANLGLDSKDGMPLLRKAAEEAVAEWEISKKEHADYTDFSKHLIATMRIKLKSAEGKKPAAAEPAKDSEDDAFTQRRKAFWKELCEVAKGKCSEETLKAFFAYWSEPTAAATPEERKMRYELQRVWNTASRLASWQRNERRPAARAPSVTAVHNVAAAQKERETQQQKREAEYAERKAKCVTREQYLEMVKNGEIAVTPPKPV
ncbi:MAG: DUF4373 domain-containing protein [Alloprevotella sp.]